MRHTFKHIMTALCLGVVFAGCSDWDDHYENTSAQTVNSTATLWENLSVLEAGRFSQFASLVKKAGYDTVLTASQTYTVWAPVNGAITNYDELMQMSVDRLRTEFVENHIAHNSYPASGAIDHRIIMLNKKVDYFTGDPAGYLLNDSHISMPNIPSVNGVIHALEGQMPFRPNVYEGLDTLDERISDFARFFHSFDHSVLNLAKSTPGPVVDGEMTYLDSVCDNWNDLYDRFRAYINVEDSNYTMIVPTNYAYQNALERVKKYYNYTPHFFYRDNTSTNAQMMHELEVNIDAEYLHDSIVKRAMLQQLFINNNYSDNRKLKTGELLPDSLYNTMNVKLFSDDVNKLFYNTERRVMSNGVMYYVNDTLGLPDWITWNPFIRIEAEDGGARANVFNGTALTQGAYWDPTVYGNSLEMPSNNRYLEVIPLSQSNNPEVDFYISGVRSTTYNVYGVFVPDMTKVQRDSTEEGWSDYYYPLDNVKPNRVRVQMGYNNEDGTSVEKWFGSSRGSTTFDTDPSRIDTVFFGEFTFPIAYVHTGYAPYIRIESRVTNANFDRNLRIDCVLLIPKELDLYLKEHPEYELNNWGLRQRYWYR